MLQVPYFPPMQSLQEFTPQRCKQLMQIASGLETPLELTVKSVRTWAMSAQVAETFQAPPSPSLPADWMVYMGPGSHIIGMKRPSIIHRSLQLNY